MAQFKPGTVRVVNASATVRAIWVANMTNITGTFGNGDTVTWQSGSGTGTVTTWDTGTNTLYFYRTSGNKPAVNDTVTKDGSNHADIASFGVGSPRNFNTNVSAGDWFVTGSYDVNYQIGGSLDVDQFDLSSNYGGPTTDEESYTVQQDFTTNRSYPLFKLGDTQALTILGRAMQSIDTDISRIAYVQRTSSGSGSKTIDWTTGHLFEYTCSGGTTFTFTAPAGPATLVMKIVVSGAGSKTMTWPGTVIWVGGTGYTTTSGGDGDIDKVNFYYDGTNYLAEFNKDYT